MAKFSQDADIIFRSWVRSSMTSLACEYIKFPCESLMRPVNRDGPGGSCVSSNLLRIPPSKQPVTLCCQIWTRDYHCLVLLISQALFACAYPLIRLHSTLVLCFLCSGSSGRSTTGYSIPVGIAAGHFSACIKLPKLGVQRVTSNIH